VRHFESPPPEEKVPTDPGASHWLRDALRSAFERDPEDALNDALALADILEVRLRSHLGLPPTNVAQKNSVGR
jgi:hypothetical protein